MLPFILSARRPILTVLIPLNLSLLPEVLLQLSVATAALGTVVTILQAINNSPLLYLFVRSTFIK